MRGLAVAVAVVPAAALFAVLIGWSGERTGAVAGLAVLPILLAWATGSAGGLSGSRWRRRVDLWATAGLSLSLAGGAILAGILEGTGAFGLPRALVAVVVGVFLIPLALTTIGFAVAFEPPSEEDLDRLRRSPAP